ncbi:LamG-like jellyroll fold domain-containing protein [Halorubrum sp. CBA1125]|uniref:LamG-like jellyroll fold domain-containing protein n=1 Tax=Halorubrum sp. CBA1125 TaxID=2668072 RepID=UPI0018D2608E|nr:LamG-like jellyroll fold domain-containing protein [Halorubrum sp. CBA1125]
MTNERHDRVDETAKPDRETERTYRRSTESNGTDDPVSAGDSGGPAPSVSRRTVLRGVALTGLGAGLSGVGGTATAQQSTTGDRFRFVSVPDMFNWDIPNPQPGWEDAIDWFLDRIKDEDPSFVLNAGDVMDARWWDDETQVETLCDQFWGGYKDRFDERNLPLYVAPGDHERGDNDWGSHKLSLVPAFEESFVDIFDPPMNGPPNKQGLAYYFVESDVLFVTVDTWEQDGGSWSLSVTGDQLDWFEGVLADHQDVDHVVVQGHVPVVGPVDSEYSSALMLDGGQSSAFWQTMVDYGVDAYLCGEHHAITTKQVDGIWQIVHGALWGNSSDLNYLVGTVQDNRLVLELKEFLVDYSGGTLQTKSAELGNRSGGPSAEIAITDGSKQNGPQTVETIVIDGCDCSDAASQWVDGDATVIDESTHGNDGSLVGDVSAATGHQGTGQGLTFDGGYVDAGSDASLDITEPPLTVECWVKPGDPASGDGFQPYVVKVPDGGGQYSLHRPDQNHDSGGQLEFAMQSPSGEWQWVRTPIPTPWQGTWHHLAAVYDGSTLTMYVDGQSAASTSTSISMNGSSNALEIGRNPYHTDRHVSPGTVVDQVRVYRSALSPNQLGYDNPRTEPTGNDDAVLWYDFETIQAGGLTLDASMATSGSIQPGSTETIDATLTNGTDAAMEDVDLSVDAPYGWSTTATTATSVGTIAAGDSVSASWELSISGDASDGDYDVFVEASVTTPDGPCCVTSTIDVTVAGPGIPDPVDGSTPTDPDGDGDYEDVDGDSQVTDADLDVYADHIDDPELTDQVEAFDYNDNGRIDHGDLIELFEEMEQ